MRVLHKPEAQAKGRDFLRLRFKDGKKPVDDVPFALGSQAEDEDAPARYQSRDLQDVERLWRLP
jgi:hypothetical protein